MVIKDTKYQVVINTVLIILSLMCVMPFILLFHHFRDGTGEDRLPVLAHGDRPVRL